MDRAKIEAFLDQFTGFLAGTTTIGLLAIADRSGLSAYLGENSGGTTEQIAEGAGLNERYVREILSGLTAAGVLEYEPSSESFTLPPEHALFISDDSSPYFMGGWMDMLPAVMDHVNAVSEATIHGGGVGFEDFGPEIIDGIARGNTPSQRAFLTSRWLPAVPGLSDRLQEGIRIADVGCGSGTAAITIAKTHPNCEVFGFDISRASIAVAKSKSETIDNVEFHHATVEEIPTSPGFDLITSFDVIHDVVDPPAALERIREALNPGGSYLMMEPAASSSLENNLNDRGALLYGISTLHCMTQSLAYGGAGLGAAWGEERAQELARDAGFRSFDKLEDITNRFSAFYLLKP